MENMNNEIIETTEDMELVEFYDETDETGEGKVGLGTVVLGLGLALGAGAVALVVKNKDKIKAKLTERKIAKLESQGYIVVTPEDVAAAEEEFVEGEVIDTNETEE